jgi:hypothetical protein
VVVVVSYIALVKLLQAKHEETARDPTEILLPDAIDLPGGLTPASSQATGLSLGASSITPLQTLLCSTYSIPTDQARDWLTAAGSQINCYREDFWQLVAGAARAHG